MREPGPRTYEKAGFTNSLGRSVSMRDGRCIIVLRNLTVDGALAGIGVVRVSVSLTRADRSAKSSANARSNNATLTSTV